MMRPLYVLLLALTLAALLVVTGASRAAPEPIQAAPAPAQSAAPSSPNNQIILPGDSVRGPAAGNQDNAQIVAGGGGYLVVWEDSRTNFTGASDNPNVPDGYPGPQTYRDVYAVRLDANGQLLDTTPIVVQEATFEQSHIRVAWNGQNWLIVWNTRRVESFSTTYDVLAARVSPQTGLLDPTPIVVDATDAVDELYPVVASDGTNWVVAWIDLGDYFEIDAARIAPDGTPLDPGGVPIYQPPGSPDFPALNAIAFAGGEYLLAMSRYLSSDDIYAMRITPALQRIDQAPFVVSSAQGNQVGVDVKGNGTDFFLAWHDDRNFGGTQVYGARVTQAGQVLDPGGINVSGFNGGYPYPTVAWDGTQWFVLWDNRDTTLAYAARVATSGTVLDPGGVAISPGAALAPTGAGMPGGGIRTAFADGRAAGPLPRDIATSTMSAGGTVGPAAKVSLGAPAQRQPDIASNGNGYMAVFISDVSGETRIKAQRLDANGNAIDAEPFLITGGAATLRSPAVAWNGSLYLVVWEDSTGLGTVYARRVQPDGTVLDQTPLTIMQGNLPDVSALDDVFLVVDTLETPHEIRNIKGVRVRGTDGVILDPTPVNLIGNYALYPHVATFANRWLVVAEVHPTHDNPNSTPNGRFVNADSSLGTAFAIASTSGGRTPNIAVGNNQALLLYYLTTGGPEDVYARRIQPDGTLLDGSLGFAVTTAPNPQFLPSAAWDGTNYVVAYEDYRNFNPLDRPVSDLYTSRVTSAGTVLDPNGVPVANRFAPEISPAVAGLPGSVIIGFSNFIESAPYGAYRLTLEHLSAGQVPTPAPTQTPQPTATPRCGLDGDYQMDVQSGVQIVPGTTDIGLHCSNCRTSLTLPFPVALYDQTFTAATISSNGVLQFGSNVDDVNNYCLPYGQFNYAIMPLWDYQSTNESGGGIFTSISGTAPNRVFNIEWRTSLFISGTGNYEVRLYENSPTHQFDIIFGQVTFSDSATTGVQRGNGSRYTQFRCNLNGLTAGTAVIFTQPVCGTGTPVPPSGTPTRTATPGGATSTPVGTTTPTACAVQFVDVPQGSTFYDVIRCLACQGIVGGYPCGGPGEPCPGNYFRPNNNVTRGQVSKIVSESGGFADPVPSTQQTFADVAPGSTFHLWIERLAGRSLIGGYPCGGPGEPCQGPGNRPYFRPNNPVTRGQLAKIVSGAAGWTETPTGQTFEDAPPGSTFYLYTERMSARGIIGGYPCGGVSEPCVAPANRPYFRPNNSATRGQMSKIAAQAFFPNCQALARR